MVRRKETPPDRGQDREQRKKAQDTKHRDAKQRHAEHIDTGDTD